MAVDILVLKNEFLSSTRAALYSAAVLAHDYNELTTLINAVSSPPTTVVVGLVSAMALQQNVVAAEYLVLTVAQRDLWNALLTTTAARGQLALSNTLIRGQIGGVWSAATTTRSNLSNLQTRPCTRAEGLFGEGTVIGLPTVQYAIES